jgi:hypothetical protein
MVTSITINIDTIEAMSNAGVPKWNGLATPKRGRLAQRRRVDLAQRPRHQRAEHQAEQQRDPAPEPGQEPGEREHGDQRDACEQQARGLDAVLLVRDPLDRDRQQRDADQRDHRAGHHRWEEPDQPREERRGQHHERGADERGAVDDAQRVARPVLLDDREHRRDVGERDAVDQRQPGAEPPDAERLQQGRQARGEQARADQQAQLPRCEADGGADDQRGRDDPGVHRGHVLHPADDQLWCGRFGVDGMPGGHGRGAGHVAPQNVGSVCQARPASSASSRMTVPSMRPYGRSAA